MASRDIPLQQLADASLQRASEDNPAPTAGDMPARSTAVPATPPATGFLSRLAVHRSERNADRMNAPTIPLRPRAAAPNWYEPPRSRQLTCCNAPCCVIITVVVAHMVYASLLYGEISANAYPMPRKPGQETYRAIVAMSWFSYIIGFLVASFDTFVVVGLVSSGLDSGYRYDCASFCIASIVQGVAFFGTYILVFAMPSFFIAPAIQKHSYAHACQGDWIQLLIDGRTDERPVGRATAVFSLVNTKETLFSFVSTAHTDGASFDLESVRQNSPILPALRNVSFNFQTNRISGICFDSSVSSEQCMSGYVWPFDGFFVETMIKGEPRRLRNQYHDWSFGNQPSLLLHAVTTGPLLHPVLKTWTTQTGHCHRLKACLMRGAEGDIVSPELLVAVGWLLEKQAIYARVCD